MDQAFQKQLSEAIEANFADSSFSAKDFARIIGMSQSNLLKKVRSITGKTTNQLIREARLEKAKALLQDESLTASMVAIQTGFSSQAYFTSCFRKQFGYSPGKTTSQQNTSDSVEPHHNVALNGDVPKPNNITPSKKAIRFGGIFVIIVAVVFIILALTGSFKKEISIAVLPFRSNDQGIVSKITCETLRSKITTSLAQIKVFDVKSFASSSQYGDDASKSIPKIGRELKAKYIIEGSISEVNDQYQFILQLINAKKRRHDKIATKFLLNKENLNADLVEIAEYVAYQLNTVLEPGVHSEILVKCSLSDESMNNYFLGGSFMNFEKGIIPFKAIPYYREAIKLDPSWHYSYIDLAMALAKRYSSTPNQETAEERLNVIQTAHKIRPGSWSCNEFLKYYLDNGEFNKALKWYKKIQRKYKDNLYFSLGRHARIFGRWKYAEKMLLNELKSDPDGIQINWQLGETYNLMRDFPTANHHLKHVIAVNPNYTINYFYLASILLKWNGLPQEALDVIEESTSKHPWRGWNPIRANWINTLSFIYQGEYEDALKELSDWFMVPGRFSPPYYYHPKYLYYAMVYGYMGNQSLERTYYDSTRIFIENKLEEMTAYKNRPEVISCLGMAYAGLGDTEMAIEKANSVKGMLKKNTDHFKGPFAMEDVAWIYTKTGNYQKALKTIRKLLSKPGPLTAKLLEIDPKWAALRDQPGYKELVDKFTIEVADIHVEKKETTDLKIK